MTLFRRNHRKTLVCDGQLAFTGGINIADEWLPVEEGGGGWLDSADSGDPSRTTPPGPGGAAQ